MNDSDQNQTATILNFLYKNYKPLIIFPVIAAVAALVVSFILPKKYEAHAEIFPTYFTSVDQNLDNPMFGYDVEADRVLKILRSESIKDSIVNKFSLYKYWDIDTTAKNYRFYLNNLYFKNIRFNRTPAMSIVISVLTYDADFSVQIVNEILHQVDVVRDRMIKSNIISAYEINKTESQKIKEELDTIISKIKDIRARNNIYYPSLNQNMVVSSNIENNGSARTDLENLENEYYLKLDLYKLAYGKMKKAEQMLNTPINSVYVLDKATTDYKKKSPRTIVNVLGATVLSFFLVLIFLYFIAEFKNRAAYVKGK